MSDSKETNSADDEQQRDDDAQTENDQDASPDEPNPSGDDFESQAEEGQIGFFREFWEFLKYNKKWWLAPIIFWLLIIAGLVILGGSVIAPFIYTF